MSDAETEKLINQLCSDIESLQRTVEELEREKAELETIAALQRTQITAEIERTLENRLGLLRDAESFLCDPRAGPVANHLAKQIEEHIAATGEEE